MHVAGVVALLSLLVVVAALGYLHLAPTGLSPLHNAVSQYGISKYKAGYRVATIAFAISGAALAFAISRATNGDASATVVLLIAFAAARAVISWFPMDTPGTERTSTGAAHHLLAAVAFVGAALAALKLTRVLEHQHLLHNLASVSRVIGILMIVCLVGLVFSRGIPAVRKGFGLIERGFYVSAIVWFGIFSIACITAT